MKVVVPHRHVLTTEPPQMRGNISHRERGVMGRGSSPDSRLMLIADKSLCDLRYQDKEVKKLFPGKKISSCTTAALDAAKMSHWSHSNCLQSQDWLSPTKAGEHGIKSIKRFVGCCRQRACSLCRSAPKGHYPQMKKNPALNTLDEGLGW